MYTSAGDSNNITTSSAAAAEIPMDMVPNRQYLLTARGADLWFAITVPTGGSVTSPAGAPTAAAVATAGSHFLANGRTFAVAAISVRTRVSIIRDAATNATGVLSEIPTVRAA